MSRNRFWGTPIPMWLSDDGEEMVVVGSIAELKELSGVTVTGLRPTGTPNPNPNPTPNPNPNPNPIPNPNPNPNPIPNPNPNPNPNPIPNPDPIPEPSPVRQAYLDGEETALIVEDDLVVDDAPHWPETMQDVVAGAPADWGVLQLWTNNPSFYKYIHQGRSGDQVDPNPYPNPNQVP